MRTEHYLKVLEINGKTSVDFRGCGPDVGKGATGGVTRGAAMATATWGAWALLACGMLPKVNFHLGQNPVFSPPPQK